MLKIISLFFMALVFVGCNNSSGTSNGTPPQGNPGNNDVTELGYDPDERWPDQGEFSYSHRYSYNGSICETGKQKFGNRADYCMGLQDQRRNNNCALSSRKSTYNKDCGYDFQELNFEGEFYRSGFDSHLKKQCSTSNSVTIFRNLKHYCDFLRDESLHQNCFWADRYKHFRAKECNGEFSHAPEAISDPIFTPEPTEPNPQPIQPEDPVQEIQVVKELKEQGIATRVDWDAIRRASSRPLPGEPSIQEKMNIVWSEIAANKNEIIKRKNQIRNLEITIYTDYRNHSDSKELAVDLKLNAMNSKTIFHYLIN